MKKLSSLLLLFLSLSLVSCSSDDSGGSNGGDQVGSLYIKFNLNGQDYSFEPETMTTLQMLVRGDKETNGVFTSISLWMPVEPTVGSHPITDAFPTDANINTLHNANVWVGEEIVDATTGTMVITEVTEHHVKGTFSFSGTNDNGTAATVTNGSFRALK
ncbi:MAG: hypothetical protein EOO07_21385 [Chitinophagaceae bacterium]|nr:MAG: hypothetical protein EOO07_21385 [Chitinophagaceae bacterium]